MICKKVSRYVQNVSRAHMEWVSSLLYTRVRGGNIVNPLCCTTWKLCFPAHLLTIVLGFNSFSPAYVYIKRCKQAFFSLLIVSREVLTIA